MTESRLNKLVLAVGVTLILLATAVIPPRYIRHELIVINTIANGVVNNIVTQMLHNENKKPCKLLTYRAPTSRYVVRPVNEYYEFILAKSNLSYSFSPTKNVPLVNYDSPNLT